MAYEGDSLVVLTFACGLGTFHAVFGLESRLGIPLPHPYRLLVRV
jgi:hypothetical protein